MTSLRLSLAFIATLAACKTTGHRHEPIPDEIESVSEDVYRLVKVFDRIEGSNDETPYVLVVRVGPFSFSGPDDPVLIRLRHRPHLAEGKCFTSHSPRDQAWQERECPVFPNRIGVPSMPPL